MNKDYGCNKRYTIVYNRDRHQKQCKERDETFKRLIRENPKLAKRFKK